MTASERAAIVYARIALGSAFLSAVAARFGLWHDRGPHPFAAFIKYTAEVNSFLPPSLGPFLAVAATIAEASLGIALIGGFRLRWSAAGSAVLLALFGTAMSISGGIKSALDASVFSASAAALLLAAAAGREDVSSGDGSQDRVVGPRVPAAMQSPLQSEIAGIALTPLTVARTR